jgi:hypothetical protein
MKILWKEVLTAFINSQAVHVPTAVRKTMKDHDKGNEIKRDGDICFYFLSFPQAPVL